MQILRYHLRPIQSLSRVELIEISIVVSKGVTLPVYKDEVIALSRGSLGPEAVLHMTMDLDTSTVFPQK